MELYTFKVRRTLDGIVKVSLYQIPASNRTHAFFLLGQVKRAEGAVYEVLDVQTRTHHTRYAIYVGKDLHSWCSPDVYQDAIADAQKFGYDRVYEILAQGQCLMSGVRNNRVPNGIGALLIATHATPALETLLSGRGSAMPSERWCKKNKLVVRITSKFVKKNGRL